MTGLVSSFLGVWRYRPVELELIWPLWGTSVWGRRPKLFRDRDCSGGPALAALVDHASMRHDVEQRLAWPWLLCQFCEFVLGQPGRGGEARWSREPCLVSFPCHQRGAAYDTSSPALFCFPDIVGTFATSSGRYHDDKPSIRSPDATLPEDHGCASRLHSCVLSVQGLSSWCGCQFNGNFGFIHYVSLVATNGGI